jgi:polyhydroxyalkanoate synthesis regulator phasin
MAGVLEDDLVAAAGDVDAAFARMSPRIARGMHDAEPAVRELVGAATDLAERALPGVETAARNAQPAIEGVRDFAGQAGVGISDMFTNMSRGSADAGAGMRQFGAITRDLLGFLGQLLANLASNHNELGVLQGALAQVESALLKVTSAGSPVITFLHGFGEAGSGTLGVISGLVTLLSALPPQVTQFGGSLLATNMILSKFGVDATKGFDGFTEKVKAAKGPVNSLKAAGQGLIEGAFSPAAIATVGLSILLSELGRRQQEAAQKASQHKEAVQNLVQALREDAGVIGDASKAAVAKGLADRDAASNAGALGYSMATVQAAALGNATALETVKHHTDNLIDTWVKQGKIGGDNQWMLEAHIKSLRENGGAAADAAYDTGTLTKAEQDQLAAALNLTGAIGSQVAAAREAHDVYLAQEEGLTGLSQAYIEVRDRAIEAFNATQQLNNAQLGLRGAVLTTQEATETYDKVMKNHTSSTRDKEKATLDLERAQQAEIAAAYQQGIANSSAATDQAKAADGMRAANVEAVKLASTFNGPLPASLQQSISKMTVTEAQALGLKVSINNVGQAVYTLPNGKQIVLTGDNSQALDAANAVQRAVSELHDKTVWITIAQRGSSPNGISPTGRPVYSAEGNLLAPFADGGIAGYADGGLRPMSGNVGTVVPPNTWRVVGDNMVYPELYAPLNGSARTRDLITAGAKHEGIGLDRPVPVPAQRSRAVVNIGSFHPPANASPMNIAEDLDWLSRTGG